MRFVTHSGTPATTQPSLNPNIKMSAQDLGVAIATQVKYYVGNPAIDWELSRKPQLTLGQPLPQTLTYSDRGVFSEKRR